VAGGTYPGNLLSTIAACAQAGRSVPCVTVVNHDGLPAEIKRVSPSTVTVFRRVAGKDDPSPEQRGWPSGEDWYRYIASINGIVDGADYTQCANEWFTDNGRPAAAFVRFRDFYLQLMDAFAARGRHCTVLDLRPGHLEMNQFEVLRPVFAQAERQGHAVNYHMYGTSGKNWDMTADAGYFALRWVPWLKDYPRLKIIGGEAGNYNGPRYRDPLTTVNMMTQLQGLLQPHAAQVIGACWWTLAGTPGDWAPDDWQAALGAYAAWMQR
jgi:hypothetical protein